jgi:hydroxymethylpyrimidine pyrophosphatase-like HAD family hydrolase
MKYLALACDYDETIATAGQVTPPTLQSLARLRHSGRQLILVTGRELDDLLDICPDVSVFDRIVGENGGVLYNPRTGRTRTLAESPPADFVEVLRTAGVTPLAVGQVLVATTSAHGRTVQQSIARRGHGFQVVLNRDSLMVLPAGVDKASGLRAALEELRLTCDQCVGVGDAENDAVFLSICGTAVAVANAIPALREQANLVTQGARGEGIAELIDLLIKSDEFRRRTGSAVLDGRSTHEV